MYPIILILGKAIPMYSLCIAAGVGIAGFVAVVFLQKPYASDHDRFDLVVAISFAMIGVVLGGKIVYFLINAPSIVTNWERICEAPGGIQNLISGGFVFYGGLLGAVFMIWLCSKWFSGGFVPMLLNLIPVVPIVHAFGRIGCFMAGCCYGIEYHGPGHVVFTHALGGAPNGVELFPVQLVEAVGNLLIAAVLLWYHGKNPHTVSILGYYLISYAVLRFVLEFFRGDGERGILWGLATSQWISLILIPIGLVVIGRQKKKEIKYEKIEGGQKHVL